jgi:hypothetical protein
MRQGRRICGGLFGFCTQVDPFGPLAIAFWLARSLPGQPELRDRCTRRRFVHRHEVDGAGVLVVRRHGGGDPEPDEAAGYLRALQLLGALADDDVEEISASR